MTKVRKLPSQSPECIMHAKTVLAVHPSTEAFIDRSANVVRIMYVTDPLMGHVQHIGFGITAESAWHDAAGNVTREALPEKKTPGSPTWSLASDEQYWKDKDHAKTIS